MKKSHKKMSEDVRPIKNKNKLHQFEAELLKHGKMARRNYTAFMVSMKCLLRVSDVITLKCKQIYKPNGKIYHTINTTDQKTKKFNILDLKPLKTELSTYLDWRKAHNIQSPWLFPKYNDSSNHMSRYALYRAYKRVASYLGIKHVGTHLGRQCGALLLYESSGNLALVQSMLNHSKTSTTLRYLDLKSPTQMNAIEHVNW